MTEFKEVIDERTLHNTVEAAVIQGSVLNGAKVFDEEEYRELRGGNKNRIIKPQVDILIPLPNNDSVKKAIKLMIEHVNNSVKEKPAYFMLEIRSRDNFVTNFHYQMKLKTYSEIVKIEEVVTDNVTEQESK